MRRARTAAAREGERSWAASPVDREVGGSVVAIEPHARFGVVFERHRLVLERYALRLCGSSAEADDLVQETFLRAMPHFDHLPASANHIAWLSRILSRIFYDRLKHQGVERRARPDLDATQELLWELPVATVSDDDLRAAIDTLEPELREVIELHYLEQRSYREIAARLGVPSGTVGTRLLRARARLHELLTASPPTAVALRSAISVRP